MKQFFGMSQGGTLIEAIRGLNDPKLIMLMSNKEQFSVHVEELEKQFPGVPSIGCIGMCYDSKVVEHGVGIVAFTQGVSIKVNVLERVSTMPVKYIERLEQDIKHINASAQDTVCIDFCTNNDACVLTTIGSVLRKKNISLMGGTGDAGKVSLNGKIIEDAAVYALIKNNGGKVRVYKENIYKPMMEHRFIASKTDKKNYILGELNGRSAKQVYQDILQIKESEITTRTFQNPFGKIFGKEICIISIKEVSGSALSCFRQVNDSDILNLLELGDYEQIVKNTIQTIQRDFTKISGVFSVNCLFRYLLFQERNYMSQYLKEMSVLNNHAGLVGYGEHYNNQFVNQSMSCAVFE